MRIDKYLKVSRLVKRRSVAKDLCDHGHVLVNGKVVKGSYEVLVEDEIKVTYGYREITVVVREIKEVVRKEDVGELYDLVSVVKLKEEEDEN